MSTTMRKLLAAEVKADSASSVIDAVASTGDGDRDKDRLNPTGCQFGNFLKTGGPILWAHQYAEPPIGKALSVAVVGNAIVMRIQFAPTPFAQEIFGLYKDGFMRSFSVGFIPGQSEPNELGGRDFHTWELLETSAVPVPANANAVALLTAKGIFERAWAPGLAFRQRNKQDEDEDSAPGYGQSCALARELRAKLAAHHRSLAETHGAAAQAFGPIAVPDPQLGDGDDDDEERQRAAWRRHFARIPVREFDDSHALAEFLAPFEPDPVTHALELANATPALLDALARRVVDAGLRKALGRVD